MPPKLSQKQTVIVNIGDKVIKKKKKRKRRVKKSAATPSGVAYPSSFVAQQITLAQQAQSLQLQSLANTQGHNNLITDGRDSEIKRITAERDEGLRLLEQQRSAQAALPPARPVSAPRDASVRDMSAQPDVRPEFQQEQAERKQRTRFVGFAQPNRPSNADLLSKLEEEEQEPFFSPPPAFKPINRPREPSPPPSPKQVEKQETIEFLKGEEAKKIELAPPVLPEKRQRATKEEMRIRREKEAEKLLPPPPPPPPPPIPPPPLSKLELATSTSSDKSPRSPAVARTLSDPKVLSEKKLSSGRDTLMTEDQKAEEAEEALLADFVDIDARIDGQTKTDKKADKKAKQDARLEVDRLLKQNEAQKLKDKQSSLVKGVVRDRKEHRSRSQSLERILSPAETRRVSKDLQDELFSPANAPTESPLFSNPSRISSLDFVAPSPSPQLPARSSSLDFVGASPARARPLLKKLTPARTMSSETTIKVRKKRPPKTEGEATPLRPSRSTSPRRTLGSSVGQHPLRTAFYETPPGELGGAEDTGLNL